MKYKHAKNAVVIDGFGRGMVIVNPSFVEQRFHLQRRNQIKMHELQAYRRGIWGAISDDDEEKKRAMDNSGLNSDEIMAFLEKSKREEETAEKAANAVSELRGSMASNASDDDDDMMYSDALERASASFV